jgi:hypothetical protein
VVRTNQAVVRTNQAVVRTNQAVAARSPQAAGWVDPGATAKRWAGLPLSQA